MTLETMSRAFALLALVTAAATIWLVITAATRRPVHVEYQALRLPMAFAVALVATLGSLYYSEIAHFEPCRLCWYQRIGMYPLVPVLGIAAWRRDPDVRRYALPLAGIGGAIAGYHYLLQWFPNLGGAGCSPTVPCSAAYVWEFGFVSIPFMALVAFGFVAIAVAGDPMVAEPALRRTPDRQEVPS